MAELTIYRTEPMVTRALAAEIRHDHRGFVKLLESTSGEAFGTFQRVRAEVQRAVEADSPDKVRIDVELEFSEHTVGIEAKLDHELTISQVRDQVAALGLASTLFVLVPTTRSSYEWLSAFDRVFVIEWQAVIDCFDDSRLTMADIKGDGRLLKSTIESQLDALRMQDRLPSGWRAEVWRGGSGMPSIEIESPPLPGGQCIRGQLEVAGRAMPHSIDLVSFISHIGVSVEDSPENYFDPQESDSEPAWIAHLRTLHEDVLNGNEKRLLISLRAPGHSKRERGRWKTPLAIRHLGEELSYLAKGYTDGWAIGPKTKKVSHGELEELAEVTVEIFTSWYEAETGAQ